MAKFYVHIVATTIWFNQSYD